MNYKLRKKLNVVLIGAGKAGSYHAEALSSIYNVNILGVINSGKKDPIQFREKYNISNWIKSINNITDISNIDAFIIACSSNATLNIVQEISKYKLPCLIEKPLGISLQESRQIISHFNNHSLNYVGYNRRFYSCILKSQYYINKFGNPLSIHIDAPEPLCSLIERGKKEHEINNRLILNTTHALDILTLFLGEYKKVFNFNHNSVRNGLKMDYMSFINFDYNRTASFISHWASPGNWFVKIFGEDYQIKLNLTKNSGEINIKKTRTIKFISDIDDKKFKAGILKQNYYFLTSIIEQKNMHNNLCKLNDAFISIRLAEDLKK